MIPLLRNENRKVWERNCKGSNTNSSLLFSFTTVILIPQRLRHFLVLVPFERPLVVFSAVSPSSFSGPLLQKRVRNVFRNFAVSLQVLVQLRSASACCFQERRRHRLSFLRLPVLPLLLRWLLRPFELLSGAASVSFKAFS